MKLILDYYINKDIINYLLKQEGIIDVELDNEGKYSIMTIKYDETTSPTIIFNHICLYQANKHLLVAFDKDNIKKFKTIKYKIDDMCCEYCYKGFIQDLFRNDFIKSVNLNDNFIKDKSFEFNIEYNETYSEDELINFLKEIDN